MSKRRRRAGGDRQRGEAALALPPVKPWLRTSDAPARGRPPLQSNPAVVVARMLAAGDTAPAGPAPADPPRRAPRPGPGTRGQSRVVRP